ncbi:DUF5685 family protein [Actinomycetospora sp. TBRC 11914]|uniref:DUF5685 family protein n=1 Tax=Actinomycetospora sp. TBRC 11914 TaxID=2729387 RepID=UPI00145D794B|nr:DUF5685 family protein [Actinomycetospora sp. TBRC 11914]NMO89550.1 hypothetical protein [Actinomycetospora sp. TBRC 11914]
MFGFLRPCRHHLAPELHARWSAHLCGLCLTLRDEAGQLARTTTHVDALVVSVLAEAQGVGGRRRAGPCPLRGMRPAAVVTGDGARLAASTALLLAADAVSDHVEDGDGVFARRPVASAGSRVATTWARAGSTTASVVGFDPVDLLAVPARQRAAESVPGASLTAATAPTEAAVGSALAHTAVLAGRPGNVAPLDEAGRLLGRLAHLLDAVTDLDDDAARGRWNPLTATGTGRAGALAACRAAVAGIRGALGRVSFDDGAGTARRLVHQLLVHEAGRAVDRAAGTGPGERPLPPWDPATPVGDPDEDEEPDETEHDEPEDDGPARPSHPSRGLLGGCVAAVGLCCTGQVCCTDEFVGPWSGKPRQTWCGTCTDGCECGCDCCDCCSDCDGCCDCGS